MCLAIFLNYLDNPKSASNITVQSSIEYSSDSEGSDLPNLNLDPSLTEEESDNPADKPEANPLEPKQLPQSTSGE